MRATVLPLVLLFGAFACPRIALAQEVKTRYFLPKSVVTLTATVTTKNTFPADPKAGMTIGGRIETTNPSVTLATVADPAWPLALSSETALLSKNTVSVEVSAAGLLSSVNAKSEGVLGNVIKNVFGAVVSLTRGAAGIRMSAATDAENKYESDLPTHAKRRAEIKEYIGKATDQVLELEKKIISVDKHDERRALRLRVFDLQDALSDLRAELLLADAHFAAWKARMESAREARVEHVEDADDLPDDSGVAALAASKDKELMIDAVVNAACTSFGVTTKGCPYGEIVRQTRVVVTQVPLSVEPDVRLDAKPGQISPAIFYRTLRPIALSVYLLDGGNKPVRSRRSVEFVTGRRSPLMSVAVQNSKWSLKSIGVTFTNGALTKVTNETGSEIAGAAEALRGLPTEYLAAVKQANEIVSEDSKLKLAGVTAQIDQLKKQKELIEAQVVSGESGDLASMQAQTVRLDAELKLLTSQRALAGAQGPGASDTALAVQMLTLQNALADAQLKQLQLQQQLEELRKKLGGGQ